MKKETVKKAEKRIKIYDKNGNSREIKESQVKNWVGKGYELTAPKEETQKEENK